MRQFFGALHYEFLMQVRRPAVWIVMFLIGALTASLFVGRGAFLLVMQQRDALSNAASLLGIAQFILPVGVGCLLADRLVRDRKTNVEELFMTMPATLSARVLGKYCGSLLATMMPLLHLLLLGSIYMFMYTFDFLIFPLVLLAFVVIALPGLCFVAAFSIACPRFMWVPIYQFLFIGYWFWGNLLPPSSIPTLSQTILTPYGGFMMSGLFGNRMFFREVSAFDAISSIIVLFSITALVLITLIWLMKWQQARQ